MRVLAKRNKTFALNCYGSCGRMFVLEIHHWSIGVFPLVRLDGVITLHYIENLYVYSPHQSVIYDLF